MDCIDILTTMGYRGNSLTSTNYRIFHLLRCFPLLPGDNTSPFPHVWQTGHVSLLDEWMLCSMLYRTLASHWLGKCLLLQLSHGHKRGIVPICDANQLFQFTMELVPKTLHWRLGPQGLGGGGLWRTHKIAVVLMDCIVLKYEKLLK
jgi:hypothetical protein